MRTNTIHLPCFAGFYEQEFTDNWIECEREYIKDENPDLSEDERDALLPEINYRATYEAVSERITAEYRERFTEQFEGIVTGLEYEYLDSPKEYNFRTDEIVARITYDLYSLLALIEPDDFQAWLRENYSSGNGFISFIETDYELFFAELGDEIESGDEYSTYLTVIFEYLCRDWAMFVPDDLDCRYECIVTK